MTKLKKIKKWGSRARKQADRAEAAAERAEAAVRRLTEATGEDHREGSRPPVYTAPRVD